MPFTPPVWRDRTPGFDVTAEKLDHLGQQYSTVAADIGDPATPVGAALAQAVANASFTDNGDGTITLANGSFTDNGDGTITLGG